MGRALFALISGEDMERVGPVPGPHCMGVTPPRDPAVRPHHLPMHPRAPSPPRTHREHIFPAGHLVGAESLESTELEAGCKRKCARAWAGNRVQ